ncbi:hypothetical protein SAMN05892877_1184 [Rhizobium subbaraonis]|uniref:Uncharacterized protein n=1 Tax=Rhizobium subbaraonis TaxID=908946 RepID=A0A285UWQ8_9HYPH|nr:hypothetical protein SAMN05892877_1184 [Rhizobium subbaraonis]
MRGTFIVPLNATQGVFETFMGLTIEEVHCTYSVSGRGQNKAVMEVLISP